MLGQAIAFCLTATFIQDTPELLPETPDGWRYERLEFPLSFAPDLKYAGFEELQFAGMFQPESESYFSYVLAIQLEGDVDLDATLVDSFLTKYYHGLCKAVGESRSLDLDLSKINVDVEPHGTRFLATVDMYDAFVTGAPLSLHFELDVHPGPGVTELFGIASPKPKDAPIWGRMRAIGDQWRAGRAMPVFLNHLFVVPDAETFAALSGSDSLRGGLAVTEDRTTVRRDMTYTGVYFYGERTYFEFLPPGDLPAGSTGVAFGLESKGGTDIIAARLKDKSVNTFPGVRTRELDGEQIPWFKIMGVEQPHTRSSLALFTMEYDPLFLQRWHPGPKPTPTPARQGIARRAVLRRYASTIPSAGDPLLHDITEVHLTVDEGERKRLLEVCRVFGYDIKQQAGTWTCRGPQYSLVIRASETPGGVTGFKMSLHRPVDREPMKLGNATLTFDDATATLTFNP